MGTATKVAVGRPLALRSENPVRRAVFAAILLTAVLGSGLAAVLAASSQPGDPALNADARYATVSAHAQSGTGTESGTYLPPLAGPQSEITGTVVADSGAGPIDFYVAAVDDRGRDHFWHGATDAGGHFHLRIPQIVAGVAALLLFKHFDAHGRPDEGATCHIAGPAAHLENTEAAANVPARGPAIVEASTSYERGGMGEGLIQLHTRGIDPLHARVLLDGSDRSVDTLASSDESIVGRLHDDAALGRHAVSVQTGDEHTNAQLADVVTERFAPIAGLRPGQLATVHLTVDGLGSDPARVTFTVGGAASLADGKPSDTVTVDRGNATDDIRGEHPGELLVHTVLDVSIAQEVAQELPHTQERTPTPGPTTTSRVTPSPTPSPEEPHDIPTPPTIYGHDELVRCTVKPGDGYMQLTQGFWQDDRNFTKPSVLDRYRDRDYPAYGANYALVVNRPTVIAGVYHYQWYPGRQDVYPNDRDGDGHGHIMLSVESNCDWKMREPVRIQFAFYINGGEVWSRAAPQTWSVPLHGMVHRNAEFTDYILTIPAPRGWPADTAAFTPGLAGHYALFARVQHHEDASPGGPWVDVDGVEMTLNGEIVQTHGLTIHYIPLILSNAPGVSAADLAGQAGALSNIVAIDLPDLYPLQPNSNAGASQLPGSLDLGAGGGATDLSDSRRVTHPEEFMSPGLRSIFPADYHFVPTASDFENAAMESLTNTFGLQAILDQADRVVVVLSAHDYAIVAPAHSEAFTTWKKVIFVKGSASYETVGHELAHTLPWDYSQVQGATDANRVTWMLSECQIGYHNVSNNYAQGLRFIRNGVVVGGGERIVEDNYGLMAPAYLNKYIEQCTSRHLTGVLSKGKNDPDVILVRGFIGTSGAQIAAQFTPFYTLHSDTDDENDDPLADLHLRLLGAGGALLREISIAPLFLRPDDPAYAISGRHYIAFLSRIPNVPGTQVVELVSKHGGLLASKTLSAAPPVVTISLPHAGATIASDGRVSVHWSISSAAHAAFLSSVLDSIDGGKTYHALSVEQTGTTLAAKLERYGAHILRVVVTDGSRSGDATVHVTELHP